MFEVVQGSARVLNIKPENKEAIMRGGLYPAGVVTDVFFVPK